METNTLGSVEAASTGAMERTLEVSRKRTSELAKEESSIKRNRLESENLDGLPWDMEEFKDLRQLEGAFQKQMVSRMMREGAESDLEILKNETRGAIGKMMCRGIEIANGGKLE